MNVTDIYFKIGNIEIAEYAVSSDYMGFQGGSWRQ